MITSTATAILLNEIKKRCLLALLFVIPFAASSCSMAALLVSAALYSAVVVPVAAGLLPLSAVIGRLRSLLQALERSQALGVLRQAWFCSLWLHEVYSQLDGIHATTNQVLFFLLSEKLLCPDQRLSCLYVLLCYTVLAYLWRSLHTRQWSQLLHETSAADFIKLTTAFVVVRLGRGVAMSLVLLTFSLHFNHLEPGGAYVLFTATYFLLTQYRGEAGEETAAVSCARYLDLPVLEGLEEYWVPLLVRATAVLMSALVACVAALDASLLPLALLVGYSNVYVAGLRAAERLWEPLESQLAVVSAFPLASRSELRRRGDSTCAVCLDEMRPPGARVTPCDHVFHGACLRRCALQFGQCPLCKAPL
ncbi:uncharacterized protein LOC134538060 isoform X1 [Bacillus rossius redtenbacheri]|uniref:uncharacterized protein LOC134538060 isoform X1 n=1 Tax=Bacillus rossius redtenbacheri TaxID=93214 RepID=UPI002FDCA06D